MFPHYSKKHKTQWILSKVIIFLGILGALVGAFYKSNIQLPTLESKLSFGVGFIMLLTVGTMAFFNRIKVLFKIRSVGFVILFLMLLLLSVAMNTLLWGLGLVSIPLLIDDIFVENYFKYINIRDYWDFYKFDRMK